VVPVSPYASDKHGLKPVALACLVRISECLVKQVTQRL